MTRSDKILSRLQCVRDRLQEPYFIVYYYICRYYIVPNTKLTPLYHEKLHTYFRNKVSHMNALVMNSIA